MMYLRKRSEGLRDERTAGILVLALVLALSLVSTGCVGLAGSNQQAPNPNGASGTTISNPSTSRITTDSATITWTTSAPANSMVEYGRTPAYGSQTPVNPFMVTSHSVSLTGLSAGSLYHYKIHSRDGANKDLASNDLTLTTASGSDTVPPSVSITSPASGAIVTGNVTVTANASDNVGVVGVQFKVDGASTGPELTAAPYAYAWNTAAMSNGNHTITAVARDAAGNVATSAAVTVKVNNAPTPNAIPPSVSITSPASGATVSGAITVSATASDNVGVAGVQFKLDGANLGSEDASAPYSISWNTASVSNGNHTLTAVARDAAGNVATSAAVVVKVNNAPTPDTIPPSVSITLPASGATVSGTITVSATASDNVGVVGVQFKVDGANTGAEETAGPYTYALDTRALSNGSHSLTAVARDAAGNRTTSAAVNITVNNSTPPPPGTIPPSVSITSPASGATVSGTITVSATASDNVGVVGVQFKVDGANTGAEEAAGPYTYALDTKTLSNGSHSLTAVARDAAGNRTTSAAVTINVNNAPASSAPVISGVLASGISPSSAIITWTTNVPATSQVDYGTSTGYGQSSAPDLSVVTSHSVTLANLSASTLYHFRVDSRDASSNLANSADFTFNTLVNPPSGGGGGASSGSQGWTQLPNTKLKSVCPPSSGGYDFNFYCQNVVAAWSSGVFDAKRNRLIVWGGGHNDYYGNELYALDLNTQTMQRLNNPSPINTVLSNSCISTLSDGKPNSRHTYDTLVYIAHADKMYAYSGSLACGPGSGDSDTWTLDLGTLQWKRMAGNGGSALVGFNLSSVADYDPVTKLVYLDDRKGFYSYNYDTDTYAQLNSDAYVTLNTTAVIDPQRRLFMIWGPKEAGGPGLYVINIAPGSNYAVQDWSGQANGCGGLMGSVTNDMPGLAYDSTHDRIVGWVNGGNGNTVYIYDPNTKSCSTQTFSGGPAVNSEVRGTMGRFRYVAASDEFVLVNDAAQNAFVLRLSGSAPPPPAPTAPTISGVTSTNISTSGATITWATDVPTTSQVNYGPTTAYGSSTSLDSNLMLSHSVSLSGLSSNTLYHYRVRSKDSGGTESVSGDSAFGTSNSTDNTPPSVSITAPASGATISNSVTVTANASDNVGVAGVQFLLDGANLGGEKTSSPYSVAWDTTTVANGAHTLTARARDAAGNTATSASVSVTVSNSASGGSGGGSGPLPSADFQTRCAAAGVLRCVSFDSPADIAGRYGDNTAINYTDGPYTSPNAPQIDTSVKASGTGSLRFTIPSQCGEGCPGWYYANFTPDLSVTFGDKNNPPNEFYVQWRQRFSSTMLSTHYTDSNGFKQAIITQGDRPGQPTANSCLAIGLVLENSGQRGIPQMYHSCGQKDDSYEPLQVFNAPQDPGQYELQNAIPHCIWMETGPVAIPPCIGYKPDQWMSFQIHVKVGTWYVNNSHIYHKDSAVQMWVGYEGQPSVLVIDFSPDSGNQGGYDLANDDPANNRYGKVWLLPYQTNKNATQVTPVGNTWYDELIISRNKIADPK